MADFIPWTERESKTYQDAEMLASNWYARLDARKLGWMTWKTNPSGREYLFHGKDRAGNGAYIGPRSEETEAQLAQFKADKAEAEENEARDEATKEAKFIRAVRLNRMPNGPAKIIRSFERAGLGASLMVVGTHALYAYEVAGALRFSPNLTATRDVDLLWDSRVGIELAIDPQEAQQPGFMAVLKKIDKSFTVSMEHSFRVTSASGLMVDFLMAEPDDGRKPVLQDAVTPIGLPGQQWLMTAPPMERIVFSEDGLPVRLRVPQPSLFAAHKEWVAARKDRRVEKKSRDQAQARAVREALVDRLVDDADVSGLVANISPSAS
jgi:hypothetical protein